MTTRTYFFVGVGMAGLIFLIGTFFGDGIAAWAIEQKFQAALRGQTVFELLVFEPVRFTFAADTRIIASIIIIFVWPIVFLMMVLIVLGLVIMSGIDTTNRIQDARGGR